MYIGKSNTPQKRLKRHLSASCNCASHLGQWLREIISCGKVPNLVVLCETSTKFWKKEEMRYIRVARALGINLVNSTDGGEGITMTPQTRAKLAAAQLGRTHSPETRAKMSAARLGRKFAPLALEHRTKIGLANLGNRHGMFGRTQSTEARAAISAANKGKHRSPETRAKISASRLAKFKLSHDE